MRFPISLGALLAAAVLLASCAPKAPGAGPGTRSGSSTTSLATAASAAAPVSADEVRDRLMAAGLAVPKQPMAADDFELPALAGGTVKLSSLRGRVVVLNFWATWCPPCRGEMPSMERLHRQLRAQGLELVAVDLAESKEVVRTFVNQNKLTFTVLLDGSGSVGGAWGAQSIPTTYLVDRTGGIIARAVGGREWDSAEMIALFETLLAAE